MAKRRYNLSKPRTPEQLAHLQPNKAEDTKGKTVPVTAKIDPDDLAKLDALPGDRSYKIRQAIRDYIQRHTNNHTNDPPHPTDSSPQ